MIKYVRCEEALLTLNGNRLTNLIKIKNANDKDIKAFINSIEKMTTFNSNAIKLPMSDYSTNYNKKGSFVSADVTSQTTSLYNVNLGRKTSINTHLTKLFSSIKTMGVIKEDIVGETASPMNKKFTLATWLNNGANQPNHSSNHLAVPTSKYISAKIPALRPKSKGFSSLKVYQDGKALEVQLDQVEERFDDFEELKVYGKLKKWWK